MGANSIIAAASIANWALIPEIVLVDDGTAIGAGEPEGRMVKRDPHTKTDDEKARLLGTCFQ